ncbi:hypothetical protein AB9P05_20180 [Roseivirga sp. BDSF3-8]|uniref:hypothetical protein n=1 Tax=Roseivirga sp. BDSF3-8 TaxID=3241598 RepID=UPI00353218FF
MDIEALNRDMIKLVELKNELSQMDYNQPEYDDKEETLHDMEDDFLEQYGDYLEDALHMVHDEYCPDDDVLLPTAYLAKEYVAKGDGKYDVKASDGVPVELDDFGGKIGRLALIPNPVRLVLTIGKQHKEAVWQAK